MPIRVDDSAKKATLPPDIRYLNWDRSHSNAWTDETFRSYVITALDSFVSSHPWCDRWHVTERFEGAPGRAVDINRRRTDGDGNVTRGPSNLPYPPNTLQSNNVPLLVMTVRRADKRVTFEYGMSLPDGNQTDPAWLAVLLQKMVGSFEGKYSQSVETLG